MNQYIIVHHQKPFDPMHSTIVAAFHENCSQPSESLISELRQLTLATISDQANKDYRAYQFVTNDDLARLLVDDLELGQCVFTHQPGSIETNVYCVDSINGWFTRASIALIHTFRLIKLPPFSYPTIITMAHRSINSQSGDSQHVEQLTNGGCTNTQCISAQCTGCQPCDGGQDDQDDNKLTMSGLYREVAELKSEIIKIGTHQSVRKTRSPRSKPKKTTDEDKLTVMSQIVSFNKDTLKHIEDNDDNIIEGI